MEIIKYAFLLIALAGCGLTLPKEDKSSPLKEEVLQGDSLKGTFSSLDGGSIDLQADSAKIQVLLFVSETCSVCREETEALVTDRNNRGIPTNAAFYSVVVGSVPQDATDWKNSLHVNWVVGLDEGDNLFRSYCPDLLTPCAIVRNPSTGIITKFVGAHSLSEWERATGNWSY